MKFLFALGLITNLCLTLAYLVDPPTTASADTIEDCTYWQVASEIDTCASIIGQWGPLIPFTEAEFYTYVC
jgi:hypothetical protein